MNPFLEHADRAIPSSVKRKDNAAQKRALAKVQREKDKLSEFYKASWAAKRRELINGAPVINNTIYEDLVTLVEGAGASDGDRLVEAARLAFPFDQEHRQFLLSCIANSCIRIRREMDLVPFDDPIPFGGPDGSNVFLDCKRELRL